MKKLGKGILYTSGIIVLLILILYVSPYRYLLKGIRLTYLKGKSSANFYDKQDFDLRKVEKGTEILPLPKSVYYNKAELTSELKDMLNKTNSGSFIVLRNDSIIAEHYFNGHSDTTASNSFSMAKSIVTMLVQIAIQEGKIKSWDEKAITYLPWLSGPYAKDLTLRHLSTMTSGIEWSEKYKDPFSIMAKAYYCDDVDELMRSTPVVDKPGEKFIYQSGSTQLLSMALRQATGKSPADYASEKLWKKIGMEEPAYWHLDKAKGSELCYCCFNAISRDYARLGILLEHNGMGIVDSTFMLEARKPYKADHYGHSFWIANKTDNPFFFMHGFQGQYIAVVPSQNLVIVRTGAGQQRGEMPTPDCIQLYVNESVKMFGRK
ncbi:MAG: serine hydrolase domain-containing protein [Sphingomonadales bacterium]|jgi:CubicO group peptidase (beta-lactamase class C family)